MSSHEMTVGNIYGAQPFPVCPAELLCDVHALKKYASFFITLYFCSFANAECAHATSPLTLNQLNKNMTKIIDL